MPRGTVLGWALALSVASCTPAEAPLTVFAAASLTDIAQEVAAATPGGEVRVVTGATSLLARQIAQGAPADVFLSAHPMWVRHLGAAGRVRSPVVPLATGELVVVARRGASRRASTPTQALEAAGRIAIADPAHVPAGRYAREALGDAWGDVEPRVVPTSDVRAALVAVEQGAADAAIVYASDVLRSEALAVVYRFASGPAVRYEGVVVGDHPDAAGWLRGLASQSQAWRRLGFKPPAP